MPVVREAWIRMTPTMPMGAGFFRLDNPCRAPVALTGVASPAFADVSMHRTQVQGGISRMQPAPRVDIAAGGRVQFAPGGLHLMLMSPTAKLAPYSRARVELKLADGRKLPVDFVVRSAAP
ncbi:hypothetical protein PAGU2595_013680 [Lysobacter xanthus]